MRTRDDHQRGTVPERGGVSVEWLSLWIILALAFALSFRALFDVGRAAGLGALAWALPVIVDGFAILAARVVERLQSRWARLYPWTLLIGLVGISAWWNGLHAGGDVVLHPTVAAVVAGAPPVILGLAYHLLRMVTNAQPPGRSVSDDGHEHVDRRAANDGAPGAHVQAQLLASGAAQTGRNGNGAARARRAPVKERAWEWYRLQRGAGHEPTAPELARAVETSAGNARKLVAAFRLQWQQAQSSLPHATPNQRS